MTDSESLFPALRTWVAADPEGRVQTVAEDPSIVDDVGKLLDEIDRVRGLIEDFAGGDLDPLVALGKIGLGGQRDPFSDVPFEDEDPC